MIKKCIISMINFIFRMVPINKNKIVFWSARGKIDEHPRELFFYIKEQKIKKFDVIWIVDKETDVSELDKGEYCYYRTLKGYYELASAKYWIQSQSLGSMIKKKKQQIYIQTFHGQGALKKMGIDVEGNESSIAVNNITKDWDWLITTDPINEAVMRSCLDYHGKCMMLGAANTDYLINATEQDIDRIKTQIGFETNRRTILYAPTFRDDDLIKLSQEKNRDKRIKLIKDRIPVFQLGNLNDSVVLLRLHPQMRQVLEGIELPDNFIDVCGYPDMKPLLLVSDMLISDYSDIVIAYSVLKRPMVFYAYDYDEYAKTRGFYIDYKNEVPGPIVYTEQELYEVIENGEIYNDRYKILQEQFNKKFNILNDGKVSERFYSALCEKKFE